MPPSSSQTNGSKAVALGSWTVRLKIIAVGIHLCLLGRGGPTDVEESGWVMAPQEEVIQALSLQY